MLAGGFIALAGKLVTLWDARLTGNLIIIFAFIVNAGFLFIPLRRKKSAT
jgi:solute:Na+ symporter, SSS family